MKGVFDMNDRRTKNAEVFRDTEHRYSTDNDLIVTVETSIRKQKFLPEGANITGTHTLEHKEGGSCS